MVSKVLFSSQSDEWETPQELFDRVDYWYHFEIDLAATKENTKCKKFFTQEDDALIQDWTKYKSCWCNPPYSRGLQKKFIERAYEVATLTSVYEPPTRIVMLLPARTDTLAFHNYIYRKPHVHIEFLKGRLKFSGSKAPAPFPSMLVYFNPRVVKAI